MGVLDSTPWSLTVLGEGVYWTTECRNVDSVSSEDGAPIKCIYGGAYYFNGELGGISYCNVYIGETVVCF